ncbi:MAG: polysaccharide biosynthesis tyrosine autokinase [Sulfurovum sp.]|nr:polysaccharide biosynthesis tyrosine autokinase [Sulfurovum sp.]
MSKNSIVLDNKEVGEVDIKELFKILKQNKLLIILSGLLSALLFSAYAYYQPNIYEADSAIEIGPGQKSGSQKEDVLTMALGVGNVNLDTELGIMMSRKIAMTTLKKANLTHRYFAIDGYKRPQELYGESAPFEVLMKHGQNVIFSLIPINDEKYRLEAEYKEGNGTTWSYDKIHTYNKEIKNRYFDFTLLVNDVKKLDAKKYKFMVLSERNAVKDLHKNISIGQKTDKSSLIEIVYKDTVALRAKDVANSIANSYIEHAIASKTAEASSILEFIDQQLADIDNGLKKSENELEDYKESISTVSLTFKAEGVVEKLSEYESELKKIDIKKKMLDTIYKKVQAGSDLETLSVAGLNLDESLGILISKLQDALLERRPLLQQYKIAHSKVKGINRVIDQLKKMIRINIKTLKGNIDQRQSLLAQNVNDQKEMLAALPESERRLGRLQRNFTVNEKVYSFLLEKRASAVIAKAGTISANKVIDTAVLPLHPIGPKRALMSISGLLLGLLLGIGFVLFRGHLDTRIKDEDDVKNATSIPLIGAIPSFSATEGKAKVLEAPKSAASEAFRTLRTNLSFLSQSEDSLVITTTSTISGEGKTTMSINLGAVMSLTGKRTIIVDLDMRKPQLHKQLQLSNLKGISSVLAKKEKLSDVIQHIHHAEYAGLDFISSGPIPPNPSELIQSDMMARVIEELKSEYDIIFFDTPPVGLVTDALLVMPQSDISIYVLRARYSEKEFLKEIEQMKETHNIKGLGIVLNDIKYEKSGYGYGHGYYEEG